MRFIFFILLFIASNAYAQIPMFHAHNRGFGPDIVKSSLTFWIDAGSTSSYPGTGTTAYDIIGTNNGTLGNGTTYSATGGGSFLFDGVDDNITGTSVLAPGNGPFTMEVWVLPTSLPQLATLFYNGNGGANGIGMQISNGACGAGSGVKVLAGGASCNVVTNSHTVTASVWAHYVMTVDGSSNIRIYYNGTLFGGPTLFPFSTPTNPWFTHLAGNLSIMRWYSKAMTATEILQNFNAEKSRFGL